MVRHRFFALCLLLLGIETLLFSACTTIAPKPQSHATYMIAFAGPFPGTGHAAGSTTMTWKRDAGGDSNEATPTQIHLFAYLVGPFPSVEAARHVNDDAFHSIKPLATFKNNSAAIRINAPQTDDWSNKTITTSVHFPQKPGYYLLVQTAIYPEDNGTFDEDDGNYAAYYIHVM